MGKGMRTRIFTLVLACFMALGTGVSALAAEPPEIVVERGSGGRMEIHFSSRDLFDDQWKDMMPGDFAAQTVKIRNEYRGSSRVRLYFRAEAHGEKNAPVEPVKAADSNGLLQRLDLTVYQGTAESGKVIYEHKGHEAEAADEYACLTQPDGGKILLGTLKRGASMELTAVVRVPLELDNRYAGRLAELDWIFSTEEVREPDDSDDSEEPDDWDEPKRPKPDRPGPGSPDGPGAPSEPVIPVDIIQLEEPTVPAPVPPAVIPSPNTGDDTRSWPYVGLMGICLGILGLLVMKGKRK